MEEEKKKYDLKKVNFISIPALPTFNEIFQRSAWVYYGANNLMPNYLIDQYNNCSIHKAVITTKVELINGDDIICQKKPLVTIMPVNGKEILGEVFKKCSLDYVLFGGYALNIIWSKDKKSIAEIYHLDFSKVRSGKVNEDDEVDTYYYSSDWTNIRANKPEAYPVFNQNNAAPSQILYYKDYSPNNNYYPIPQYSGGLMAINIDIQIKNFHNNNLANGFTPSLFINFNNGIPGEEEKNTITKALEEQYGGTNNGGRPVINFSESKELSPEITQIGTNASDNYYSTLYDDINRSILSAHRVSSAELFGVATSGKLGGSDEIIQHSEYFRNVVIKPYQSDLLRVFDKVMSMKYEEVIKLEIKPLTIITLLDKTTTNTK